MQLPLNHALYAQILSFNWSNTFQDLGYPDSGPGARLCIPSNWWTPFLHRVHSTMALLQPVICANAGHERCYKVLQLLQLHKRLEKDLYFPIIIWQLKVATPINSFDSRMTHLSASASETSLLKRCRKAWRRSVSASCVFSQAKEDKKDWKDLER